MAYGDTLSYTYEAEIKKENGETDIKKETLHFTYNANTTLIYKRLFSTDFLQDVTKLTSGKASGVSKETVDKIVNGDISINDAADVISNSNFAVSEIDIDATIITQIAIAMTATNDSVNGYKRRTVDEIANSLPDISTNVELMLAIIEFITYGIKKKNAVKRRY